MKPTPFLLYITWFLFPFCFAGYYDFSCAPFSIMLLIHLMYLVYKRHRIILDYSISFLFLGLLIIAYLLVCFWAIDRNMTFLTIFRYLFIFLFILNFLQCTKKEQENLFKLIPFSALLLTIAGLVAYYLPSTIRNLFYSSYSVLYGSFLYKNTFALFLLLSIIILIYFHQNLLFTGISSMILSIGIYRSGCKSIMIATIIVYLVVLYHLIVKRYTKKNAHIIIFLGGVFSAITLIFLNLNYSIFSKLLTYLTNSHSLNERLLFYHDALQLLIKHPFGLGMYAFYYTQPSMQSGYYYTINVHNDFIQMGVEVGFIVLILFILVLIKGLFSKTISFLKKSLLLLIAAHSLFDFDLQYMVIFTILAMCFDYSKLKTYEIKHQFFYHLTATVLILTNIYIGLIGFFLYKDDLSTTLKLYPNTSAQVLLLAKTTDQQKGYDLASAILKHNSYIYEADLALARIYAANERFEEATSYIETALSLNPRVMRYYEYYTEIYYNAALYYQEKGDENNVNRCCQKILNLPNLLTNLSAHTLPYAYKSMWTQDFTLNQQTQVYLRQAKELQNNTT